MNGCFLCFFGMPFFHPHEREFELNNYEQVRYDKNLRNLEAKDHEYEH